MVEANIIAVFIGIESPNEESLRETKKFQNVRAGGTLLEKVHRIQDAGHGGLVRDDPRLRQRRRDDLRRARSSSSSEARIAVAMIGMLSAIPKTPLHDRLAAEGRLDPSDEPEFGTNVIPLQMSREELRDGYVRRDERASTSPRPTSSGSTISICAASSSSTSAGIAIRACIRGGPGRGRCAPGSRLSASWRGS